jgi:heptosyltransferase-2
MGLKVLIVKIGAVGDTVMSLSILSAIDQKEAGARITWVCGKTVAPLVRAANRVNEVIEVDDVQLLKGGKLGALTVLTGLWLKLLGRPFDLIVTGHSDSRYQLLSLTARGKIRRSFGEKDGRKQPVPGRYHADEYARLITGSDGPGSVPAKIPLLRVDLAEPLRGKLMGSKKTVALAPGGAKNLLRDDALRRWPLENYTVLAEKLLKQGFQVMVTGSPSDEWVKASFEHLAVTDLVGQTSLTDLVALYGRCHLVVTHDSGPLHLAIASGAPVLALFGPTAPGEKVRAGEKVKVLWGGEHLACRPCYDGRHYAGCDDNQCLKSVTAERTFQEALSMMPETTSKP